MNKDYKKKLNSILFKNLDLSENPERSVKIKLEEDLISLIEEVRKDRDKEIIEWCGKNSGWEDDGIKYINGDKSGLVDVYMLKKFLLK